MIVVGLGGMGSSAAYHLASRGFKVLGLEQFWPGHDLGSSHGDSRIFRHAYSEHPSYVPLLHRSRELFGLLSTDTGQQLFTETGGLIIGGTNSETVSRARKSAEQWDLDYEMLTAEESRRRFPTIHLRDDEVALYDPSAGYVLPEQTIESQFDLAQAAGARLVTGVRVSDWSADRGQVSLHTTHGDRFTADQLVVCAGAWSPKLLGDITTPLQVERQVMHWFHPFEAKQFREDKHPVYIWEDTDGDVGYGFPILPGEDRIKAAFFRRMDTTDPDDLQRLVSDVEISDITTEMDIRVPNAGTHDKARACMYTLTPDHNFLIGTHPQHTRVTIAAGFSGHGFKFVPVVGEILADLAQKGTTEHDIRLFDPSRSFDGISRS